MSPLFQKTRTGMPFQIVPPPFQTLRTTIGVGFAKAHIQELVPLHSHSGHWVSAAFYLHNYDLHFLCRMKMPPSERLSGPFISDP